MIADFGAWFDHTFSADVLWNSWSALLVALAVWVGIERLFPAERNQPPAEMLRNLGVGLVYMTLASIAGALVSFPAKELAAFLGGPLITVDGMIPRKVLAAFAAVWVFDFFYYWFHRLQHTWAPLWAVHRLHHSDQALNVTTSLRHHWLEEPLRAVLIIFPMALLVKITPIQAGIIGAVLAHWGTFVHANLRIPFGPLSLFFTGPQVHRIHHSIEPQHANKNFAAFLPLWDWLFGTYVKPTGWPKTGVSDHDGRVTLREVMLIR